MEGGGKLNGAKRAVLVAGFSLSQCATSTAFTTACGLLSANSPYLAAPLFTIADNVAIVLVSVAFFVVAWLRESPSAGWRIPYAAPALCLALVFGLVWMGVLGCDPRSFVVVGAVYGACSITISFCWFEMLAQLSPSQAFLCFLAGTLLGSCLAVPLEMIRIPIAALCVALLALSAAAMVYLRVTSSPCAFFKAPDASGFADMIRFMAIPLAAGMVMEWAAALMNVSLSGSSDSSLPMWATSAAVTAILFAIILWGKRIYAHQAYQTVFPVLLAVLLVCLLFDGGYGSVASVAMDVGYKFVLYSLSLTYFLAAREQDVHVIVPMSFATVAVKVSLLIGFGMAHVLAVLSNMSALTSTTISVVFVAYVLCMAAVLFGRRRTAHRMGGVDGEGDGPKAAVSGGVDDSAIVAAMACAYGLTNRERDVFALFVRGWTSKKIADHLVLAESTIWGHVRHIYEKVGVGSKQELIDRYEAYRADQLAETSAGRTE